jgi:hypothetical protein
LVIRSSLTVFAILLLGSAARATPKPLPFSYGVDTNPKGQGEVEQYVDLVPVFALNPLTGARTQYLASQLQTEIEYGLSNRVELGLYVTVIPQAAGLTLPTLTEGNGAKQRIRWRLADQGDWPIDVALYGELTENDHEIELEAKVILEHRFGHLRVIANAWVEYEFYYNGVREWVLNPTVGMTYQVSPHVFPGIEYWMRAELVAVSANIDFGHAFNDGPHHYIGPTMRLVFGNFFWTTGLYMRASNIGYVLNPGIDAYGPIWFRSLVGFSF